MNGGCNKAPPNSKNCVTRTETGKRGAVVARANETSDAEGVLSIKIESHGAGLLALSDRVIAGRVGSNSTGLGLFEFNRFTFGANADAGD